MDNSLQQNLEYALACIQKNYSQQEKNRHNVLYPRHYVKMYLSKDELHNRIFWISFSPKQKWAIGVYAAPIILNIPSDQFQEQVKGYFYTFLEMASVNLKKFESEIEPSQKFIQK